MYTALDERKDIFEIFSSNMKKFANKKIVLYGIGTNTEYIVKKNTTHQIVALMDAIHEGEEIYGLPIISAKECVKKGEIVVIVARQAVHEILYQRIKGLELQGITIVDIRGNQFNPEKRGNVKYQEFNIETAKQKIKEADVVTFDIFDTLIMRKCLRPEDIFEIAEKKIDKQFGEKSLFRRWRAEAGNQANGKYKFFNFDQLYAEFQSVSQLEKNKVKEIKQIELQTDRTFICPRKEMVDLLRYARDCGKNVLLISDMYYSASILTSILEENGIEAALYDGLEVSCEAGCEKWPEGALFKYVIKKYGISDKKILHFGDNPQADVRCAQKAGMQTYYVMNAYEMLVQSELNGLLVHVKTLPDKILLGLLCSDMLNSPFALKDGRLKQFTSSRIGYLGYGPLIFGFINWLIRKYNNTKNVRLFFFARDGYFVEKIYRHMLETYQIEGMPKPDYILASRRGVAVPAIVTENDYEEYVDRIIQVTDTGQNVLKEKFGLTLSRKEQEAIPDCLLSKEEIKFFLKPYQQRILDNAAAERRQYLRYWETFQVKEEETIIVFDTQTLGTLRYYFEKIIERKVQLVCIVLLNIPDYSYYTPEDSFAFLGDDMMYAPEYAFTGAPGLNDAVLPSDKGQFLYFDQDGTPVYDDNEPSQDNFELVQDVYKEMRRFIDDYIQLEPDYGVDLQLSPEILDDLIRRVYGYYRADSSINKKLACISKFSIILTDNFTEAKD